MVRWMKGLLVLMVASSFAMKATGLPQPRHVNPTALNRYSREVLADSMRLSAEAWDSDAKLLIAPPGTMQSAATSRRYMVRETGWYALALLLRDGPGDRAMAADALNAVLKQQYTDTAVRWYGTFRRTPAEREPSATAPVMWAQYDPNWRHFIGTTFAMILIEYPDRIPQELAERMYAAIDRAIDGEIKEGRLVPSYSNIALMYGFLWAFAAEHDGNAEWAQMAERWNESVYTLFKKENAFFEYNSPTYYGVDLYGLALWRDYGITAKAREMGGEMEARLWQDIAAFYQPGLHNISGPYDRSYGMDMESYVAVTGVWMRMALDREVAPLPKVLTLRTDHVADLWFVPHFVILGEKIPPDALAKMRQAAAPHLVERTITPERRATAWIGTKVIYGGEFTSKTKDAGSTSQFHPATVQWRTPAGPIGWIRLVKSPKLDVVADRGGLQVDTDGDVLFRVHGVAVDGARLSQGKWILPGLMVDITSDAKSYDLRADGEDLVVTYAGVHSIAMKIGRLPVVRRK